MLYGNLSVSRCICWKWPKRSESVLWSGGFSYLLMCFAVKGMKGKRNQFFVSEGIYLQPLRMNS